MPRSLQERTNKGFYSENLLVVGRRRSSKIPAAQSWLVKFDHRPDAGAPSLASARVMWFATTSASMLSVGLPLIVNMFFPDEVVEVFWMPRIYRSLLSSRLEQSMNHGNRLQRSHHTNTTIHARVTVWSGTRRVGVQSSENDSVNGEQTECYRPKRCR